MRWAHDLLNYSWAVILAARVIGGWIASHRDPPIYISIPPAPAPPPAPPAPYPFCWDHPQTYKVTRCLFCGGQDEFSYYLKVQEGVWKKICRKCHRGYHSLGRA